MSSRNIRKLAGGNTLPPPDSDSDDDLAPETRTNAYAGLIASSDSSQHETENEEIEEDAPPSNTPGPSSSKKNQKKKRKSKQMAKKHMANFEMDEIERSLKEIQEMFPMSTSQTHVAPVNAEDSMQSDTVNPFTIENKHLNVTNELNRVFGSDEEEKNKKRKRQPNIDRMNKRGLIIHIPEKFEKLPRVGLSMSVDQIEDGKRYFVFNHNKDYQRMHKAYVENTLLLQRDSWMVPVHQALQQMHVEELIEGADMFFKLEDFGQARSLLEQAIAYLQFVSHPSFRLNDINTRLQYKFRENRVFHVSLLKYMYMLTNSACHRTALELAKVLLNLDPDDPLAVIFVVDTLALRAKEYQWLIDMFEHGKTTRQLEFVLNIRYSNALANFHIIKKNKGDMSLANSLLKDAIFHFPSVVTKLLNVTGTKNERILSHSFYRTGERTTPKYLLHWTHIYAKLSGSKWREPDVLAWFTQNAIAVLEEFDEKPEFKEKVKKWNEKRMAMFQGLPKELVRHLSVIRPMAKFLFEEELPLSILPGFRAADPMPWPSPRDSINRYNYALFPVPSGAIPEESGLLQLIASIDPSYQLDRGNERRRPGPNDAAGGDGVP